MRWPFSIRGACNSLDGGHSEFQRFGLCGLHNRIESVVGDFEIAAAWNSNDGNIELVGTQNSDGGHF